MLQESSDALRLARLASTGRLAVACALELRRLLSLAAGNAAAVPGSERSTQLREVLGSAGDITRRLLTAAQRPSTTEIIDLGDLVEEMRGLFGILAGPGAVVVIVRGNARVRVVANRGDLEQILVNLVDAPDGAAGPRRIAITTGVVDGPGSAPPGVPPLATRPYALLSVTDDQRTPLAAATSTCARCGAVPALGLPLVHAMASAHQGRLVVIPSDGGVEYRVLLPLAPS
jgi:two-component system cell cycle sensor histidine kinase/response regulator CckA